MTVSSKKLRLKTRCLWIQTCSSGLLDEKVFMKHTESVLQVHNSTGTAQSEPNIFNYIFEECSFKKCSKERNTILCLRMDSYLIWTLYLRFPVLVYRNATALHSVLPQREWGLQHALVSFARWLLPLADYLNLVLRMIQDNFQALGAFHWKCFSVKVIINCTNFSALHAIVCHVTEQCGPTVLKGTFWTVSTAIADAEDKIWKHERK